jgi:hypothetical protein
MARLRDPRHEAFCQKLADFLTKSVADAQESYAEARANAYAGVGYAPSKSNARKLAGKPEIKRRLAELQERAAELGDISRAKTLVEVDRIASANLVDFFEMHGQGPKATLRVKDITRLPRSLTAALSSVEVDKQGRVRIKLHDKNPALDKIGRNLGLWEGDLKQVDVQVTVADLVSPDYAAKRAQRLAGQSVDAEDGER